MGRKVFISFLGSSFYEKCKYACGGFMSSETRFVQHATLEWLKEKEKVFPDVAIILLTQNEKGSKAVNWEKTITGRENFKTKLVEEYFGLEKVLSDLHINFLPVEIPDGKDEKEIWEIFEIIFKQIQDNDQLYFDLTHGFRYLPMLLLVLGNYAKFLRKNVSVKHISYGNYEARNEFIAPFVDLLPLSKLQDWTSAANDFEKHGNAEQLKKLTNEDIKPILEETRGQDETASKLRQLSNSIYDLSLEIKTNRGKKLIEGLSEKRIIEGLNSLQKNTIAALNPLLEQLKSEIMQIFKSENAVENMLLSVQWCINKQLVQEGFTLLQEGILSFLLSDNYEDEKRRNFISGYLAQYKSGKFDNTRFNLPIIEIMHLEKSLSGNPKITEWADIFSQITEIRNDINHAGIRQNPMKANDFRIKLDILYKKTINLVSLSTC